MPEMLFGFFRNIFFDYGINYFFTDFLFCIAFILYRISLSYTIFLNAKRRKLDNPVYWAMISFFAGTVAAVLYRIINTGAGKKSKPETSKAISLTAFFIVSAMLFAGSGLTYNYESAYAYQHSSDTVIYKKGMKYIAYDKMGNEHNVLDLVNNGFDFGLDKVPIYTREGKKAEYPCYVDKDGYALSDYNEEDIEERRYVLSDEDADYYVYFDKDKNICYSYYDCSWDKDGNLIFNDEIFAKITYENTVKVSENDIYCQ